MAAPKVKIDDLIDGLEVPTPEMQAWLDRSTGRVVLIDDEVRDALEADEDEDDEDLTFISDWQQEQVPVIRAIQADDPRYVALPTAFDFHEYRHLEKFIRTLDNPRAAERLERAIRGKGAFRRFKDAASDLSLLDAWYAHRLAAQRRFLLDWAAAESIEVDLTPGRTLLPE